MSEIDYEKLYKKWHYQILQYPGDAAMSVIPRNPQNIEYRRQILPLILNGISL